MRIALYYPWVYLTSGGERIIQELTGRSRHRWTVFTNRFERHQTFPELQNRDVVELERVSVKRSVAPAARAALRILTQRLPLEGYDALVVLCEGLGDLAVFRNGGRPRICVCMTPLRIAFDPGYRERYMQGRGAWTRALVRSAAAAFRWVDRRAWARYDHVFCISEEVRRRALRGRLAPASRLEIAHVGIGFEPEPEGVTFGDFFLLPGRIMWTKNIELGIEAFLRFRSSTPGGPRLRLVVAGLVDEKSRPYLARLRSMAAGQAAIEFHVHPSDEELRALYRTCYAVLFTAFNEDWGMIPLEAMAFGKPVIATDRGGPRETVEHGVNGYLEPPTPEAFARRMSALVADPALARAMGAAGPARARMFSWDGFVASVDERIERLHGASHRPATTPVGREALTGDRGGVAP